MKAKRRGQVARRYRMRTRIKGDPRRGDDIVTPSVLALLEEFLISWQSGGRRCDEILMAFAEEITPGPERLAEIRANLPPSPYTYDDEGDPPF